MKNMFVLSALLAVFLTGCDSDCCGDVKPAVQNGNSDPVTNTSGNKVLVAPKVNLAAIPDSVLNRQSNTQLSLDGAAYSSDEDGTVSSYNWTFKKPDGTVTNYNEQKPLFTFPVVGVYEICLTVKDNDNQTSNKSCRNVVVEDQPVYIDPEPIVTILDPVTKQPLSPDATTGHIIFTPGQKVIFDGTGSYDPDNLDSNKIVAYHWKMVEYRKYPDGYTFKYHYCNWKNMPNGEPDQPDHTSCTIDKQIADANGVPYAQLLYTIHGGSSPEIYRTVELCVEDQDAKDGNNNMGCRTYNYETTLYKGEDLTKIPAHSVHKSTL